MEFLLKMILGWVSVALFPVVYSQFEVTVHLGVIAELCPKGQTCMEQTVTRENVMLPEYNASVVLFWKYVNRTELYHVARAVYELHRENVSSCIVTSTLEYAMILPLFMRYHMKFAQYGAMVNAVSKTATQRPSCSYDPTQLPTCECHAQTGNRIFPAVTNDSFGAVSAVVIACIQQLAWDELVFMHEENMANEMNRVLVRLSDQGIVSTSAVIDSFTETDFHALIDAEANWKNSKKINIVVLCDKKCVHFLNAMSSYDMKHFRQSALRHLSRILIIQLTEDAIGQQLTNTTLDNIVLIRCPMGIPVSTNTTQTVFKSIISNMITQTVEENQDQVAYNTSEELSNMLVGSVISKFRAVNYCLCADIDTLMWGTQGREWRKVGTVDNYGQMALSSDLFPNIHHGFNQRHFKVTTLEWYPFVQKMANGSYDGLCFDIFNQIANVFNFTYDVMEPPDGEWGLELDNNSWSGAIGQLQRREVDFVVSSLTVHSRREEVMDFTMPFYYDSTVILMKKPNPNKRKWRVLIDPFDETVLICIGFALVVSSFLLYVFEKISPFYRNKSSTDPDRGLNTFQDAFWYMTGALLTQGGERLPHSQTGRSLLSCWWVFSIVMMATYSGNLIAFLTVNKDTPPFNNVEELLQQTNYKWGIIGGSYWVTIFKQSVLPEFQQIWSKIVDFNRTDTGVLNSDPNYHIDRVKNGNNYVYIGDKTQIQFELTNECSLQTAEEEILPFQYAFGLPNDSPFTSLISNELMEIHESGLLFIWKQQRWPTSRACGDGQITSPKKISMLEVQSAFYVSAVGIVLGVIVMMLEKITMRCIQRRQNRT